MRKETLVNNLKKGAIAFATLKGEETYLLCLVSKKVNYFIPLLRNKGIGSAYIDPELIDDLQYENLSSLINLLNETKILYPVKFTPKYMKVKEEFEKEVVDFARPAGIDYQMPHNIKEILEKEGYVVNIATGGAYPYKKRDYGTQIEENPEFKLQYEKEKAQLEKDGITYEKLPTSVKINYETVTAGAFDGILFVGGTGTGKTKTTELLACLSKAHREDIQLTGDSVVEDLEGRFIPDDRPGAQTKARFIEGPLLKAYYLGYVITIQEVNNAQAGVLSCLNKYLDGTLQITVNDKVYHRHPNFVTYMTMNPGFEGTLQLNGSLKNRFSIVHMPSWPIEKYCDVLEAYSVKLGHKMNKKFFRELLEYASMIQKDGTGSKWHEDFETSIRNATRLLDTILLKPRTFDEFAEAIHSQYTGLLSLDNNNCEKLEQFKQEDTVLNYLKKLYEMYDFSEIAEAKTEVENFDELFVSEEEDKESDEAEDDRKKAMSKLVDKFGLDE